MKRKIISMMMVVILIFSTMIEYFDTLEISFANDGYIDMEQLSNILQNDFANDDIGAKEYVKSKISDQLFFGDLGTGEDPKKKLEVNVSIIKDYGKLVYTEQKNNHYNYHGFGDYSKDKNGSWQYRNLGYSQYRGEIVTNSKYPNLSDAPDFFSTYMNTNWTTSPNSGEAKQSWKSWEEYAHNRDKVSQYMFNHRGIYVEGDGKTEHGAINLKRVLGKNSLDELKKYYIFNSPPTFKVDGSVRLWRLLHNGSKRYRTINIENIKFPEATLKIIPEKDLYEFATDELTKTIKVRVELIFDKNINDLDLGIKDILGSENTLSLNNIVKEGLAVENNKISEEFEIEINRDAVKVGSIAPQPFYLHANAHIIGAEPFEKDEFNFEQNGVVNVMVNAGEIEPSFKIFHDDVEVTDGIVEYTDWEDLDLTLKPNNKLFGQNEITSVIWSLEGEPSEIKMGNVDTVYQINANKLKTHCIIGGTDNNPEHTANFIMNVNAKYKFDYGKLIGIRSVDIPHCVTFKKVDKIIPQPPANLAPVAKLKAPCKIRVGDEFTLSGRDSYDKDGEIVDYDFTSLQEMEIIKKIGVKEDKVRATMLGKDGLFDAELVVTDNDGLTGSDATEIEVLPPIEAKMRVDGHRKVNRKVILNASYCEMSKYFPIDNYQWTITPLNGQNTDSIRYETGTQGEIINVLFKEEGAYNVTLDIHSQCIFRDSGADYSNLSYSDSISFPITIQPDVSPVANLSVISIALRNKGDNGNAKIEFMDASYSPDNDPIRVKAWYIRCDSDNDGEFIDEQFIQLKALEQVEQYKSSKVGRYEIYNEVEEIIDDEDTISKFLVDADIKTDNSLDIDIHKRICEIENVAPIISTTATLDKTVEIIVLTDEEGENYTKLISEINRLKKELYERKIALNEQIIEVNDMLTIHMGRYIQQIYNWYRKAYIVAHFYKYYKYTDYETTTKYHKNKIEFQIIDSKIGTVKDSMKFPIYKNAYMTKLEDYSLKNYKNGKRLTPLKYAVYNGVNDYLTTIDTFMNVMYDANYFYKYINKNGENYPDNMYAYVDKKFVQGDIKSVKQEEYKAVDINKIVEKFSDNNNDKYLVLALEDGSNLVMSEKMKASLSKHNIKVIFCVDKVWSEFTPTLPTIEKVNYKIQNEDNKKTHHWYGMTKFGHVIGHVLGKGEYYDNMGEHAELFDDKMKALENLYSDWHFKLHMEEYTDDAMVNFLNNIRNFVNISDVRLLDIDGELIDKSTMNRILYSRIGDGYKEHIVGLLDKNGNIYDYFIDVQDSTCDVYMWNIGINMNEVHKIYMSGLSSSTRSKDIPYTAVYEEDYPYISGSMTSSAYDWSTSTMIGSSLKSNLKASNNKLFSSIKARKKKKNKASYNKIWTGSYLLNFKMWDGSYNIYRGYNTFSNENHYGSYHLLFDIVDGKVVLDTAKDIVKKFYRGIHAKARDLESIVVDYNIANKYNEFSILHYNELNRIYTIDKNNNIWELFGYSGKVIGKADDVAYAYDYYEEDEDGYYNKKAFTDLYSIWAADGKIYKRLPLSDIDYKGELVEGFKDIYTLQSPYDTEDFVSIYDLTSSNPSYKLLNRGDYDKVVDLIVNQYKDYSTTQKIFIQVGDKINIGGFILDYEHDPICEKRLDVIHDSSYFDNSNQPFNPPSDFDKPFIVDVAGRMMIKLRAKDNPVGSDERFKNYRYWNKDNTVIEVIAHRRPISSLSYQLDILDGDNYKINLDYKKSYDLDHSLSRADKGIVAYEYYYRKDSDGIWSKCTDSMNLKMGQKYQFALKVQDVEGAWSEYDIKDIYLDSRNLFVLSADISKNILPAGDSFDIVADIFSNTDINEVTADINGNIVILNRMKKDGYSYHYKGSFTVPKEWKDMGYKVVVKAVQSTGMAKIQELLFTVDTPMYLEAEISPKMLTNKDILQLKAYTSYKTDRVDVNIFSGTDREQTTTLTKGIWDQKKARWIFKGSIKIDNDIAEGKQIACFTSHNNLDNKTATANDTFHLVHNAPPSVKFISYKPNAVYEGDKVNITFKVDDPDGDNLNIEYYYSYSEDDNNYKKIKSEMDVTVPYDASITIQKAKLDTFYIKVVATDPSSETSEDIIGINVSPLEIVGKVLHTKKWNNNRIQYNKAKTGHDNSPRAYNVFWSGEKLVLEAKTTIINSLGNVKCTKVHVNILGEPYEVDLNSSDDIHWYGILWHKDMIKWKSGTKSLRFTSYYSNGIIKEDVVDITIDNEELYFKIHRAF